MTIRRILIACWIPKATNTHSEYVILIALTVEDVSESGMMKYGTNVCWI